MHLFSRVGLPSFSIKIWGISDASFLARLWNNLCKRISTVKECKVVNRLYPFIEDRLYLGEVVHEYKLPCVHVSALAASSWQAVLKRGGQADRSHTCQSVSTVHVDNFHTCPAKVNSRRTRVHVDRCISRDMQSLHVYTSTPVDLCSGQRVHMYTVTSLYMFVLSVRRLVLFVFTFINAEFVRDPCEDEALCFIQECEGKASVTKSKVG